MAGLGPPKTRRCRFFDSQGNRILRNNEHGCSRSASNCHFVHPSDPEWSTLPPDPDSDPILVPRPNYKRPAGNSSPRRYSPLPSTSHHGRDRRPSPPIDRRRGSSDSSPKRRRSPSRGSSAHHSDQSPILLPRSPRRDASPSRRHASSNVTRDGRPPRRSPSPSRSFSYKRPYSDRQPDPVPKGSEKPLPSSTSMGPGARSSQKETMPPPTRSLRSRTATVSSAATGSTASGSSSGTPSTRTHSGPAGVSSRPLSEVLPPPPSLNLARKDEMTPEQRRAVWQKRITLMADATQEYLDLGKLEQDVQSRRRQVQSPAFDALSSDVKTAFQASLRNAEATYERKMGSLNSAIGKLSETDFWPPVPSQKIGDVEAKLKEAKTLLGGLADNVGQLYKRIETLYGQHSTGRSGPSSSGAKAASGDGDTRAKKRRRLSDNDDDDDNDDGGGGDSTDVPTVAAAPAPPDMREDVESIRDIIREIEDRLQEVENDMTQHSRHIVEQLETTMDEKIEEVARSADIAALVEAQLAPRTAQTIRVFDETLAHTDQEIAELAQEMAELVPRLAELQRDNDLVKQEEAVDKELLAQLVKADQDSAQAITRLQEEARTLRSALTAAHSKRALPPAPAMPPSGTFLEALKGSIAKQVQEQIAPIVAQTRTEIERIAKTRDAELYEKLRDRLEQSSKTSQLISTWIERDPDDARRVLAAAAAAAQNGGAGGSGSALT